MAKVVFVAELETSIGCFDLEVSVNKKDKIVVNVEWLGRKAKFKTTETGFTHAMKAATAFMYLDDYEARKITLKAMQALTENGLPYFNLESTKAQVDFIFG